MAKRLEEMTLEELWELFPVCIVPYDPEWKEWARIEMMELTENLKEFSPLVSHIGSTAVEWIQSKPIIDILVEISPSADFERIKRIMISEGYICMAEGETRMSFNKGYTPDGYAEKVFHIHFHFYGDNDEIRFRDYLISHPEVAKEYERLKLSLLPVFKHNRDGYTAMKGPFIKRILDES